MRTPGNPRRRAVATSSMPGSASAQTRIPPGEILRAISSECPPPPVVPSRNTSPGAGESSLNVSWKRTGICPAANDSDPERLDLPLQLGILEPFLLEPSDLLHPL